MAPDPTPTADPVAERLAGMLERHHLTLQETGSAETYVCRLLASAADIPAAVAAVEAALALAVSWQQSKERSTAAAVLRNAGRQIVNTVSAALLGEG